MSETQNKAITSVHFTEAVDPDSKLKQRRSLVFLPSYTSPKWSVMSN